MGDASRCGNFCIYGTVSPINHLSGLQHINLTSMLYILHIVPGKSFIQVTFIFHTLYIALYLWTNYFKILYISNQHSVIYWLCKSVFETIKHPTQALSWPFLCRFVLWLLCNLPSLSWLPCFYKPAQEFMLEAKHAQS